MSRQDHRRLHPRQGDTPTGRHRRAVLALGALLMFVAGCSDSSSDADEPAATVATSPPTSTTEAPTTTAAPTTTVEATTTTIPRPVNPLEEQPTAELVSDGHGFLDGIAWSQEDGALLFTDTVERQLLRLNADDSITVVRSDIPTSDFQFDTDGRLVATELGELQVTATNADESVEVLASNFEGIPFVGPNGVAVRSDGTVYFTDFALGVESELDFRGVFAVSPTGDVTAAHRYPVDAAPNGIALSPDEGTLYVGNTFGASIDLYDVAADGSLSAEPRQTITTKGSPDGICVDGAGNIFVATIGVGIEGFDSAGTSIGVVAIPSPDFGTPGQMSNCEVGGEDGRTLFVQTAGNLYRVPLA